MNNLYIALLHAEAICSRAEWPIGLAVYYDPGAVSTESNETLSYCFLERMSTRLAVCSEWHATLNERWTRAAKNLLDRERRRIDANLPADWPQGTRPEMRRWAELLYRLSYFEPGHRFVAGLLNCVQTGCMLSAKQTTAIQVIYDERGGIEGLRRRQHAQWRLMRLAKIEMQPSDCATVKRLARFAGEPGGLRESTLPVLGALEAQYWRERLEAAKRRAEQIAAELLTSKTQNSGQSASGPS
jgi:hypothetical protein